MPADEFLRGREASPRDGARIKPCPATSSPSNMTARRLSAGRCRRTGLRCRGAWPKPSRPSLAKRRVPRGAGRTDAGVHALGQVAHIDLAKDWPPWKVRDALNAQLRPDPISVLDCEHVADDFDARFSATARHYLYRIVNRRSPLALDRDRAWQVAARSRRRRHERGGAASGRASRLHHLPVLGVPGGLAGQDAGRLCR